jgi:hypothetical protein
MRPEVISAMCFGGLKHGQVVALPDRRQFVPFPVIRRCPLCSSELDELPATNYSVYTYELRRVTLCSRQLALESTPARRKAWALFGEDFELRCQSHGGREPVLGVEDKAALRSFLAEHPWTFPELTSHCWVMTPYRRPTTIDPPFRYVLPDGTELPPDENSYASEVLA